MCVLHEQLDTVRINGTTDGIAWIRDVGVCAAEIANEQLRAILGIGLHRILRTNHAHRKRRVCRSACTGELLVHCHARKIKIGYCHFLFPYLYVLGSYSYAFKHRALRVYYPTQIAARYSMYSCAVDLFALHLRLYKIRSVHFQDLQRLQHTAVLRYIHSITYKKPCQYLAQ